MQSFTTKNKENVVYIHNYYSAIKQNEVMLFLRKWKELEIIVVSKKSQAQKDRYCMVFLTYGIWI